MLREIKTWRLMETSQLPPEKCGNRYRKRKQINNGYFIIQ